MKRILSGVLALALAGGAAFADLRVGFNFNVGTDLFYAFKLLPGDDAHPGKPTRMGSFGNWWLGDTNVYFDGTFAEGRAGAYFSINLNDWGTGVRPGDIVGWVKPVDFLELRITNGAMRNINRFRAILDRVGSNWGPLVIGEFNENDPDQPVKLPLEGFGDGESFQNLSLGTTDAERLGGYFIGFNFNVVKLDFAISNKEISGANDFETFAILFSEEQQRVGAGTRITVPVQGLGQFAAIYRVDYDLNHKVTPYTTKVPGINDPVTRYKKNTEINRHAFGVYADFNAIQNFGIAVGYSGDIGFFSRETSPTNVPGAQYTPATSVINLHAAEIRGGWYPGDFSLEFMQNFTAGLYGEANHKSYASKTDFGISYNLTDMATIYLELSNRFVTIYSADNGTRLMAHDSIYVVPRVYLGITPYAKFFFDIRGEFDLYNMIRDGGIDHNLQKRLQIKVPLTLEINM